jgi:hypothetical protein
MGAPVSIAKYSHVFQRNFVLGTHSPLFNR